MPYLSRIVVYPIKSLDGGQRTECQVLPSGALEFDRRFALRDAGENAINGKRHPKIHRLRTAFDYESLCFTFQVDGRSQSFHVPHEREQIEAFLSAYFETPTRLVENSESGFPDDPEAPGPTVVSAATLEVVASWFPDLTVEEIRGRFRANLEIGGVEPFWEDRLCGEPGTAVPFRVGQVTLLGVNPCQRCVVPTRAPATGEPYPGFAQIFMARRRETLPAWATLSRFDHFNRLSVNTRLAIPGTVHVGDVVELNSIA